LGHDLLQALFGRVKGGWTRRDGVVVVVAAVEKGLGVGAGGFGVCGRLVLVGHELLDRLGVVDEHLHADEGLAALLREHWPGLGSREQVADAALGEAEDALAEEALADGELGEEVLDLPHQLVRVDEGVAVELLLGDGRQD